MFKGASAESGLTIFLRSFRKKAGTPASVTARTHEAVAAARGSRINGVTWARGYPSAFTVLQESVVPLAGPKGYCWIPSLPIDRSPYAWRSSVLGGVYKGRCAYEDNSLLYRRDQNNKRASRAPSPGARAFSAAATPQGAVVQAAIGRLDKTASKRNLPLGFDRCGINLPVAPTLEHRSSRTPLERWRDKDVVMLLFAILLLAYFLPLAMKEIKRTYPEPLSEASLTLTPPTGNKKAQKNSSNTEGSKPCGPQKERWKRARLFVPVGQHGGESTVTATSEEDTNFKESMNSTPRRRRYSRSVLQRQQTEELWGGKTEQDRPLDLSSDESATLASSQATTADLQTHSTPLLWRESTENMWDSQEGQHMGIAPAEKGMASDINGVTTADTASTDASCRDASYSSDTLSSDCLTKDSGETQASIGDLSASLDESTSSWRTPYQASEVESSTNQLRSLRTAQPEVEKSVEHREDALDRFRQMLQDARQSLAHEEGPAIDLGGGMYSDFIRATGAGNPTGDTVRAAEAQLDFACRKADGHPSGHRQIIESLRHLAKLVECEDWGRAWSLYQNALEMDEARLGPDCMEVVETLQSFGKGCQRVGRLAQAEHAFRRAVRILEANLFSAHEEVGYALEALGSCLVLQGRDAEAEPLLQRALSTLEGLPNIRAKFVVLHLQRERSSRARHQACRRQ